MTAILARCRSKKALQRWCQHQWQWKFEELSMTQGKKRNREWECLFGERYSNSTWLWGIWEKEPNSTSAVPWKEDSTSGAGKSQHGVVPVLGESKGRYCWNSLTSLESRSMASWWFGPHPWFVKGRSGASLHSVTDQPPGWQDYFQSKYHGLLPAVS